MEQCLHISEVKNFSTNGETKIIIMIFRNNDFQKMIFRHLWLQAVYPSCTLLDDMLYQKERVNKSGKYGIQERK